MARLADQYRRSDVRFWGIVAATTTVLAVASLNAPGLIPGKVFASLHMTRLPAPDNGVAALKLQIAQLEDRQASLGAAGAQLATRVSATEQDAGSIRHDVTTLVANLPKLVKTVPIGSTIDDALVTGAIGLPKPGISGGASQTADVAMTPSHPDTIASPPAVADSGGAIPSVAGSAVTALVVRTAATAFSAAPAAKAAGSPVVVASAAPPASTVAAASSSSPVRPPLSAAASMPAADAPVSHPSDLVAEIRAYEWAQDAVPIFNQATPKPGAIASTAPGPVASAESTETAPAQNPSSPVPLAPVRATPTNTAAASADPPAKADVRAVGVAIGAPVQPSNALPAWQDLASKVGVMLVGMSPLLAEDPAGSGGKVLVAGPVANIAAATALCGRIDDFGLSCTPMPYVGANLAPAQ